VYGKTYAGATGPVTLAGSLAVHDGAHRRR
jgi:hypothetical protein